MLHWIQYMKGYVTIKVWGYSTERLLNLCGNHDILVWDIVNHGDYDTLNISIEGFFALKPLLKKTGTKASVLKRYGLPFFVSKMQRRKIFVIGLVGCMLFWILTSGYIWNIKIEGNYVLTEDVLMDYLTEQGVHAAMKKKQLRIEELEESLREEYDVITWTSVQVEGTTLLIYIKENDMPEYDQSGQQENAEGMDLIATRSGTVSYIITRSGVPQVALGDQVEKGTILVSGAVPVYNEDTTVRKYQFVEADADIILRYSESVSVKRDILYEEKQYTGKQKNMPLFGIRDKEWSLGLGRIPYDTYDISEEKNQVRLLDHLYLPLFYGHRTVQEYEMVQQKYTEDEMKNIMQDEWSKIISTLEEKGVQITEKNVTIKKNDNNWVLNARMQLEESAVRLVPTQTEPIAEESSEDELPEETQAVQENR
ncbi:MAG: sporulation protein YqfD [Lachnospiraceae bacterium]|nr:sporulation protein YqfD [Lachnospiraceae bacterium]